MSQVSRRALLQGMGAILLAVPLLEACGAASGSQAAAVAAQAKSEASSVQAAVSASTASSTSTSAQVTATAPASSGASKAQTPLSIAVWANSTRNWQKQYAQKWAAQNPDVKLTIVEIPYSGMAQKTLTELATNTVQDVIFSTNKWLPNAATQGAFLPLDSYVQVKGKGTALKDYFPAVIADCTVNGKLYALPFELNTGNTNIVFYNQDILEKAGAAIPTDSWTLNEFVATATKATDASKRVWGTDLFPGSYYDFDCWARTYGGELLSTDGKSFQLTSNTACVDAAQWIYNLRALSHAAPSRQQSQGIAFPAGQIALSCEGIYAYIGLKQSIGTKFKWGVALAPTSPSGQRGYEIFASVWAIYNKTKQPEHAFELIDYLNSASTQTATLVSQGQPPTRISVWESKEAASISPIWGRVAKWLTDPKDQGPFPMPYNYRYSELEDKWTNIGPSLWYGQTAFQSGLQQLQQACQSVLQLTRI